MDKLISDEELLNFPDSYWTEPGKIVTDKSILGIKSTPVESLDLGEKIAAKLLHTLNKHKTGIGLSAIQIGIPKNVFVMRLGDIKIFINPEIIEASQDKFVHEESCLSIPNKRYMVSRHNKIKVKSDYSSDTIVLGIDTNEINNPDYYQKIIESAVFQHEFDHLNGMLITDIDIKTKPIVKDNKYKRNDIVKVRLSSGEVKEMKYKKFLSIKDNKYEILQ